MAARRADRADSPPSDKLPPQSIENERSVLGAMLFDARAVNDVVELLGDDDFYNESHRKIYRAVLTLYEARQPVDSVTVVEQLRRQGDLDDVGGAAYLTELAHEVPTAANAQAYAKIVRQKAVMRSLITSCTEVVRRAFDETEDPDKLLDSAEQLIFEIAERKLTEQFMPLGDLVMSSMERIEDIVKNMGGITGLPTGYRDLDVLLSGLQRSELIILAARTSIGKTSFALNIAENVAFKGHPVGIFSLEMSRDLIVQRLLCSHGRVNLQRVRTGHVRGEVLQQLVPAAAELAEVPIFIDDSPSISVLEMRAKARRLAATKGLDLVIIDYLQLVQSRVRSDSRQQEVAEISRSLKAMARELEVPVIAISQLSRQVDMRESGKPRLSDLRESGSIEQDADVVIFLTREREQEYTEGPETASAQVAKQRNGPLGRVDLTFLKEYTRFEDQAAASYAEMY